MSLLAFRALRIATAKKSFSTGAWLASSGKEGAIREAGGKFGEIEAATENVYMKKLVCV
jgi:hypothetical protein